MVSVDIDDSALEMTMTLIDVVVLVTAIPYDLRSYAVDMLTHIK